MSGMKAAQTRSVLTALLDASGAAWTEAAGWIRFRLEQDGRTWELCCLPTDGQVLCYGRYPFRLDNLPEGLRRCSEVNRQAVRGAMFLEEDGRPVFRTTAEMDDAWGSRERLASAIEYNAAVLSRFWGVMSPNGFPQRFRNPAEADLFPFQINAAPPESGQGESV